jgi:hypothetical protein
MYPHFFQKKEVGLWFNPDSYRDRLGSKNLPIGGFFAFYAPSVSFVCVFDFTPIFSKKKK